LEFEIWQKPIPQKRHRHTKSGHTFDPSYKEKKAFFKESIIYAPYKPIEGGVGVELLFFMQRPKSHYGTGKNAEKLKPQAPYEHIKTPDTDNLVKFVLDALGTEQIFFKDDRQIVSVKARKLYANRRANTRTYVCLYAIDEEEIQRWNLN